MPLAAQIALARQKTARAEGYARAGVELARKSARDPRRSADLGRARVQLGKVQRARGLAVNAQQSFGEAVLALAGGQGPDHLEVAGANALLAAGAPATVAGT